MKLPANAVIAREKLTGYLLRKLPENVNDAVKSSFLLSFLESVPQGLGEAQGTQPQSPQVRGRGEGRRAGGGAGAGLLR